MAVHLDAATRAAVASAAAELRARAGDLAVSWVAPDNFHVTVKFLGGVDAGKVPAFVTALESAAGRYRPFTLAISGLGAYPSTTRPRVLWAGITAGSEALAALAGDVDEALAMLGIERETRAFSGHVTIGRVRDPGRSPALTKALTAGAARSFGEVPVAAIALMRSQLSPRGARYTALATVPLAA